VTRSPKIRIVILPNARVAPPNSPVPSVCDLTSLDYSYGGLRSTCDALGAAGLAHAGTGADLAAARAPAFADTAAGRVALVSATSSFPAFARAGAARTDAAGRPGVNPHPMKWSRKSRATTGFPVPATGPAAKLILDHVAELSVPYDTQVSVADDVGWVTIP
jgi:hypothetical protein